MKGLINVDFLPEMFGEKKANDGLVTLVINGGTVQIQGVTVPRDS